MDLNTLGIPNLKALSPEIWTGGQPTPDQLRQAQAAGLRSVISLCPHGECGWDEGKFVTDLGMTAHTLPVGAACDLSVSAAHALHDLLDDVPKPVLVHCGSSNRVGALFALKSHFVEGHSYDAALAHGRDAGLTGLEATVRDLMTQANAGESHD
ncbi:hypothetical protein [uncultured Abyssibacter sp.]|uniref:hypothetical protein n=1 Tax=uncultured Abyssibacter sp. TaxID=2320202 RepID=UPI0032B1A42B